MAKSRTAFPAGGPVTIWHDSPPRSRVKLYRKFPAKDGIAAQWPRFLTICDGFFRDRVAFDGRIDRESVRCLSKDKMLARMATETESGGLRAQVAGSEQTILLLQSGSPNSDAAPVRSYDNHRHPEQPPWASPATTANPLREIRPKNPAPPAPPVRFRDAGVGKTTNKSIPSAVARYESKRGR